MVALKQEGFLVQLSVTRTASTVASVGAFLTRTALVSAVALGWLVASGCAPLPTEADERLDSNTGTTLTVMPRPVELLVVRPNGTKNDPFAYLAPFETNRMGSHEMFLWVSAPQIAGTLGVPKVFCGEEEIPLEVAKETLKDMGLSSAPYALPAPWSVQWYFKLSGEVLDCLARAPRLKVTTQAGDAAPEDYTAEASALTGLGEFSARVRT
jgi:hypothetical protein